VKAAVVPETAVKPLVDALKDPETQVRANAAFALSRLDRPPPEAVPLLAECTTDPSESLRVNATLALRKTPAAAVGEVMESLLEDPSARVRLIAAGALLTNDPTHSQARSSVEAARTDPSPRVREAAEDLLQSLAAPAETAVAVGADAPTTAEVVPLIT
jgi:vesicle coat complex subunit